MTKLKKDTTPADAAVHEQDMAAKAEEYLTGWRRTQADFENYRKRTEEAKADWMKLAAADSLLKVAPILDDFRRAFEHIPFEAQDSPWVAGVRQVEKHLRATLTAGGLEPIESTGVFDPNLHEAIAYEDHPELPEGTIIGIVETGWKLGDRIIKPARVRVSRGQAN